LLQRTLTALVGIPVLVGAVWLGAPWLTLLVLLIGVLSIGELYRLLPPGMGSLPVTLGALWVISLLLGGQTGSGVENFLIISSGILAGGAFVAVLWLIALYSGPRLPTAGVYLIGGPVYVGFLLAHALALREVADGADLGRNWLLFALLVTFATDTGAFLVGRSLGRRYLAPSISPNKTWEGCAGGFACGVAAALALGLVIDLAAPRWQQGIVAATVGVVAQWGDLFESKLKRISSVKDAGSIIPGHGGILDRMDSVLVSVPAVYYLLVTVFEP